MTRGPGSLFRQAGGCILLTFVGSCGSPEGDAPQPRMPGPDLSGISDSRLILAIETAQAEVRRQYSAESWGRLGHTYLIHGWPEEAATCYGRAVDVEPEQFRWHYFRGRSLSEIDLPAAAAAFETAIRLDSTYVPAYLHGARILRDMGQLATAVDYLERARAVAPDSPLVELRLAQLWLSSGGFRDARRHLLRALELDPDMGEVHAALSQVSMAEGDRSGARRHAELAAGESEGGMAIADPLFAEVKRVGVSRFWLGTRGKSRLQDGDYDGALLQFAQLLDNPDEADPMVWCGYGGALLGLGRDDEATAALERALTEAESRHRAEDSLSPENLRLIHTNLGHAYAVTERPEAAQRHLREALHLDPASASAAFNLALVYFRADSLHLARDVLESVADLDGHPQAPQLLSTVRKRTAERL